MTKTTEPDTPGKKTITISLPQATLKKAREKAFIERRSLSAQVSVWIDEATKEEGK